VNSIAAKLDSSRGHDIAVPRCGRTGFPLLSRPGSTCGHGFSNIRPAHADQLRHCYLARRPRDRVYGFIIRLDPFPVYP